MNMLNPIAHEITGLLRRRSALPIWADLIWRLVFILALVMLVVAVHWFHRDGIHDNADGHMSFADIVYFTAVSISTLGYGDIVPVSPQARLFEAIVVTPVRLIVWLIFLGTAYNLFIQKTLYRWRMAQIQKMLSDHVIVAGFGVSGGEAVREMIARGTPAEKIVVVDCSAERLTEAEHMGCNVIRGDATRDRTLDAVHITSARALLVSAGQDDTSILITLTARHLASDIPISIVVRNEDNEILARQAGATTVINPVSFTGLLLAGSGNGPHTADYIADLASAAGAVQLSERPVDAAEVGRPLSAIATGLGVRIMREGRSIGFDEEGAQQLEAGDVIIEITDGRAAKKAR